MCNNNSKWTFNFKLNANKGQNLGERGKKECLTKFRVIYDDDDDDVKSQHTKNNKIMWFHCHHFHDDDDNNDDECAVCV